MTRFSIHPEAPEDGESDPREEEIAEQPAPGHGWPDHCDFLYHAHASGWAEKADG